jgi:hypothetical protein
MSDRLDAEQLGKLEDLAVELVNCDSWATFRSMAETSLGFKVTRGQAEAALKKAKQRQTAQ